MVSELKDLTSALTTPEMQKEIQDLKKECAGYRERLKNIKAATNHVTPEEKEQVRWGAGSSGEGGLPPAAAVGPSGLEAAVSLCRCTESGRSTAGSGGSGRGW